MTLDDLILPRHDWQAALDAASRLGDERPTWAYDWPAGKRLTAALAGVVDCRDRHLCDLGCGRGLLGLQALLHGAASVTFADGSPQVITWIEAVLAANPVACSAGRARVHRWGAPLPDGPYDVILGGDILYRPECFADLLATIATSLSPEGTAYLADPRTCLEAHLPALATAAGLSWDNERHSDGFTLVRCRLL